MATVTVSTATDGAIADWNPATHSGWSSASARMIAVTSKGNYVYAFPYAPKQIQYSNVASDYVTIDRPANYPLIEWRAPKLSQVSFSFLVADRPSHGVVSVETQMEFLNKLVAYRAPIMFTGMGPHLNSIIRAGNLGTGTMGIGNTRTFRAWRVTDFSYSTRDIDDSGNMTQVECQITLSEDRNPDVTIINLPRIVYQYKPAQTSSTPPSEPDNTLAKDYSQTGRPPNEGTTLLGGLVTPS